MSSHLIATFRLVNAEKIGSKLEAFADEKTLDLSYQWRGGNGVINIRELGDFCVLPKKFELYSNSTIDMIEQAIQDSNFGIKSIHTNPDNIKFNALVAHKLLDDELGEEQPSEHISKKISLGAWTVDAVVDADGHLSLFVKNSDGTEISPTDSDIGRDDEWAERFTTEGIEQAYRDSNAD